MITYIKYLFVLLLLLPATYLMAQDTGISSYSLNKNSNRLPGKLQGEIYYLNVISSANYFLQSDWEKGTVILKDGDVFREVQMKYNAYSDELVAYNDNNKTLFIIDKNTIKEFIFFNPDFRPGERSESRFVNLDSISGNPNRLFYEQLYSGSVKLLAFHRVEVKKTRLYTDVSGRLSDSEYKHETHYYYYSPQKGMVKIKLSNYRLQQLFPEHKKEMRRQLRKARININDERTAIQAFEVLDKLGLLN